MLHFSVKLKKELWHRKYPVKFAKFIMSPWGVLFCKNIPARNISANSTRFTIPQKQPPGYVL